MVPNPFSKRAVAGILLAALLALGGCDYVAGVGGQVSQAEKSLTAGDYNTAAITLRNVIAKHADNAKAQQLFAQVELLRGDLVGATSALEAAAKAGADPATIADLRAQIALERGQFKELLAASPTEFYRARALRALGRIPEALAIYDKLLAQTPDSADTNVYAAEAHAIYGRRSLAQALVDKALATTPRSARAWALRGALQQQEDAEAARSAFAKAIEYAPGQLSVREQTPLLTSAISTALGRGETAAAERAFSRLSQLLPQATLTELLGAEVSLAKGEVADAVGRLQRLQQRTPDFEAVRPALVGALLQANSLEQAVHEAGNFPVGTPNQSRISAVQSAIKAAAAAEAGSVAQALASTQALLLLEQPLAARRLLQTAITVHPDSVPLEVALVQIQLRTGAASTALQHAQALRARAPGNAATLAVLAQAQMTTGKYADATTNYQTLWRSAPSSSLTMALSLARQRSGRGDAIEPLADWLAKNPRDAAVRMLMAEAQQTRNQPVLAIKEYEVLIADQPTNAIALNNLAWLYHQTDDPRALGTAKRAYERLPAIPEIADTYGWLLTTSGSPTAAVQILRAAVGGAPGRPTVRYHLAAALVRSDEAGDRDAAQSLLHDLLRDASPFEGRSDAERLLATLQSAH